ncbi:30S ribosomal protein S12 methylthiotransferase RimO [Candidatus Bipolaricaulota bacterium]
MGSESISGPRVHLASLGCAKNLVDSEELLGRLATAGALVGAPPEEADIIIVNTCGFIGPAKEESIRTALEYGGFRKTGDVEKLIVMGCLAERDAEALKSALPDVDLFFGLHSHADILKACGLPALSESNDARLLLTPAHFAYLRISDGCDNRCSYCTIPLIRGPFQSRSPEAILVEATDLADAGVRELVVIGQDTTSYGKDLHTSYPVHRLLRELATIEGVRWIRLLYTHPAHFSAELISEYADNPKLCAYVDIPLQHLNDNILRRMGRRVSQADCLNLIERLRTQVPGIAIRTTFIVGFPGETDARFKELLELAQDIRFDHMGAFAYSAEPDTPAADLPNQVPTDVVEDRLHALMLAQQSIAFENNASMIGRTVEVLIDELTEEDGVWVGRTQFQAPDVDSMTYVMGEGLETGQFVDAEVIQTEDYDLLAQA